jgi:hypothetical protein
MTIKQAKALHAEDEVTWTDPDTFIIASIVYLGDDISNITKQNGDELGVLTKE